MVLNGFLFSLTKFFCLIKAHISKILMQVCLLLKLVNQKLGDKS